MRFTKRTLIIGMFLASSGIASCGEADTNDSDLGIEQIAGDGTHLLVGDYTNLTAVEMAEYIEDRQYMRSLAQPDQAVHLNLADPQMYRLAMNRLKISGKTPANSPQLYTAMERTRSEHVLRGYGTGLVAQMQFRSEGDGREAMHFISTAVVAGDAGEGAASSTFPEGSDYTFLDVGYYDGAVVPLAAPNIIEQFGGGTDVNVQTGADLTVSELDSYTVDTFQLEDSAAGFGASYVYTTMGLQGAQPAARPTPPVLIIDDVTAPADIAHNDGIVSICLNRAWTGDCDYDLTGNPQSVKVPLQGSIEVVSAAHRFSAGAIDDIRADLAAATPNPRSGYVKLL
ncbi:MAG: hypothetical protein K0V04_06615, partial [Deltaproteobacteria bacterium]|nr:hypothetical protein [Deltaproteobacteria bacterium]